MCANNIEKVCISPKKRQKTENCQLLNQRDDKKEQKQGKGESRRNKDEKEKRKTRN